jgi:hypothetical protein
MMKSEHKKQVNLEDLLRLKRAERPAEEFWTEFDRELRAKQLAAIMVRRPWWRVLPRRAFANLARYHLPLGASAVFALTLISVREYQIAGSAAGRASGSDHALSAEVALVAESETTASSRTAPALIQPTEEISPRFTDEAPDSSSSSLDERVASPQSLAGNVSAMNALVGVGESAERDRSRSSSVRSITDNFASLQSSDTSLDRSLLGVPHGFESRVMPARTVDPLAQVTPPSQVRRSRYLGTALPVSATSAGNTTRSSERLVNRLSDDRLYETVSRYAFGGDQVSLMVKF